MSQNKKPTAALVLGLLILTTAMILAGLLQRHADEGWRPFALWTLGLVILVWLLVEVRTVIRVAGATRDSEPHKDSRASMLVLMNEDGAGIRSWDLRNKTGLVIGRSYDGADVDVDLSGTEYFSFISNHHAVLNFTEKGWYLADAGSKNGTSLLRSGSRQKLLLAPGEPVPIRIGDTIYISEETELAVH